MNCAVTWCYLTAGACIPHCAACWRTRPLHCSVSAQWVWPPGQCVELDPAAAATANMDQQLGSAASQLEQLLKDGLRLSEVSPKLRELKLQAIKKSAFQPLQQDQWSQARIIQACRTCNAMQHPPGAHHAAGTGLLSEARPRPTAVRRAAGSGAWVSTIVELW